MKAKEANELILKNFCERYNLEVKRFFHEPYFIFANDTLKFSVKSLKGWIFAVWSRQCPDDEWDGKFSIICEHAAFVDKFKPDHTWVTINEVEPFNVTDFSAMDAYMNLMKENHHKAFVAAQCDYPPCFPAYEKTPFGSSIWGYQHEIDDDGNDYNSGISEQDFITNQITRYKRAMKAEQMWLNLAHMKQLKLAQEIVNQFGFVKYVGFFDTDTDSWRSYPKYEIVVGVSDENISDNGTEGVYEKVKVFNDFLQKYNNIGLCGAWQAESVSHLHDTFDLFPVSKGLDQKCQFIVYEENPNEVIRRKKGKEFREGIPSEFKVDRLLERAIKMSESIN